jgi:glycosyltransferase involved in cell wall biosynthesis
MCYNENMKVSVVVPVYNEEAYLDRCLTALTSQIEPADEIIVVDNNSTDRSVEIAQKYPVTIVHEKTQGMTYARNAGFDAAHYEIIARCDADTAAPPDWIKKIKHVFATRETDGVSGPIHMPDTAFGQVFLSILYLELVKFMKGGREMMIGPNMALTKKIWQKVRTTVCMDNSLVHEDLDLSFHIQMAGGKIAHDYTNIMVASGRRIRKNPFSFFVEYPSRLFSTLKAHP